ncbi:hypothetical protein F4823DRAFT_622516 [Ustulina deusta]|nr:hypothetical protein F4823DRAFT_622516 [Ustulina deusta]
MKPLITTVLLGLGIATTTIALDLYQDGPFALRIKGQAKNSSIDGYLHTVDLGSILIQKPIQYEPILSPPFGNVSYEFYFNYTGHSQSDRHEVGFFVTDPTYENPVELGVYGKAMSLQYSAGSNVAFPLVGAGSAIPTTFNKDDKVLINLYFNDSTFVPKEPPRLDQSFNYYNWAVCWQFFGNVYIPALSWVTYGSSHNPTCERVDLIKVVI